MHLRHLLLVAFLLPTIPLAAQQDGSGSGPASTSSGSDQGPVEVSSQEMALHAIHRSDPTYPSDARQAGVQGTVVLHVIINKDGTVKTASVESGPDMLRDAAINWVQQATYRPYLKDGEPVEVDTTISVNFNLGSSSSPNAVSETRDQLGPPQSPAIDALTNNATNRPVGPKGPVRISGGVMAGQIQSRVAPYYPAEARAKGIAGTVVLHAIIGKDGSIANITVISGPELLQSAALDAVKNWKYRPYLLNGEPTEVDTTIMVNFNLTRPKDVGNDNSPHY